MIILEINYSEDGYETQIADLVENEFRSEGMPKGYMENFVWSEQDYKTYLIIENNKVVSHLNLIKRNVNSNSGGPATLSVAGIGNVVTEKDYRGKGYSTKIIEKVKDDIRDVYDISLLFTRRVNFFQKLGWRPLNENYIITAPSERNEIKNITVKKYDNTFFEDIKKLYHESNKGMQFTLARPDWYFERLMNNVINPKNIALFLDGNELKGYIIIEPREKERLVEIREVCAQEDQVYENIYSYLCDLCRKHDFNNIGSFIPSNHPFYRQLEKGKTIDTISDINKAPNLFNENLMILPLREMTIPEKEILYWRPTDHF